MARAQKVSIALDKDVLLRAKKFASSAGTSLSGLLTTLLKEHFEAQARFLEMGRFLDAYAPAARVTDAEMQRIRDELDAPLKPIRRRARRKKAA